MTLWPAYALPTDTEALAAVDLRQGDRPGLERLLTACERWSALAGDEDGLTLDDLAAVACRAWMLASPAPMLRRDDRWWVDLFRTAGYARSGRRKAGPTQPVRLYRGAPDHAARSMAWTPSRALALRYASQDGALNPTGRLWSALIEPDALIAAIDVDDQLEVVVDPRELPSALLAEPIVNLTSRLFLYRQNR